MTMDNDINSARRELERIISKNQRQWRWIRFVAFLKGIPVRTRALLGLKPRKRSVAIYWNSSKDEFILEPWFQSPAGCYFLTGEPRRVVLSSDSDDRVVESLLDGFEQSRYREIEGYRLAPKEWRERFENFHHVIADREGGMISFHAHRKSPEGKSGGYLPLEHERLAVRAEAVPGEIYSMLEKALKLSVEADAPQQ